MKAHIPYNTKYSHPSQLSDRDKRHLDFSLRPWNEVAARYNEQTGENITGKNAEFIAAKAIKKLRAQLDLNKNAVVRKGMLDEIS